MGLHKRHFVSQVQSHKFFLVHSVLKLRGIERRQVNSMNHYNTWNNNISPIRMNTINDSINDVYFFYLDLHLNIYLSWAGIAQSVRGWTVRGSHPGVDEIFRTRLDRTWGSPSLLCSRTGSFQEATRPGRGADLPPI